MLASEIERDPRVMDETSTFTLSPLFLGTCVPPTPYFFLLIPSTLTGSDSSQGPGTGSVRTIIDTSCYPQGSPTLFAIECLDGVR